ncbi:hypothetical protein ABZ820_23445 [Streptomyces diacarni]|uniref:hypothetical protein n=1 Tax=Streptomyces diacarni TaxID=2800381 RepID=UPI0015F07126|nr:hypothetical protein [Streptomyces diacarni]
MTSKVRVTIDMEPSGCCRSGERWRGAAARLRDGDGSGEVGLGSSGGAGEGRSGD